MSAMGGRLSSKAEPPGLFQPVHRTFRSPLKVHVCNWFRWILELKQGRWYDVVLICCPEGTRKTLFSR